jgi:hypothetical protein
MGVGALCCFFTCPLFLSATAAQFGFIETLIVLLLSLSFSAVASAGGFPRFSQFFLFL